MDLHLTTRFRASLGRNVTRRLSRLLFAGGLVLLVHAGAIDHLHLDSAAESDCVACHLTHGGLAVDAIPAALSAETRHVVHSPLLVETAPLPRFDGLRTSRAPPAIRA